MHFTSHLLYSFFKRRILMNLFRSILQMENECVCSPFKFSLLFLPWLNGGGHTVHTGEVGREAPVTRFGSEFFNQKSRTIVRERERERERERVTKPKPRKLGFALIPAHSIANPLLRMDFFRKEKAFPISL